MQLREEDVLAAVNGYLTEQLFVPKYASGARDILLVKERAFDLLYQALILDPLSIYYLVALGSNKLRGAILKQVERLERIAELSSDLSDRTFTPIKRYDDLVAARVALLEVGTAAHDGYGVTSPGLSRFRASIGSFVGREITPSATHNGKVVDSPLALRRSIQELWRQFVAEEGRIAQQVEWYTGAFQSFGRARIPESTLSSLIQRIRQRIMDIETLVASRDTEENTVPIFYDLLVARSLLDRVTRYSVPRAVAFEGTARASTFGASYVGRSTSYGLYDIPPSSEIAFSIGGDSYTVPLTPSDGDNLVDAGTVAADINLADVPVSARTVPHSQPANFLVPAGDLSAARVVGTAHVSVNPSGILHVVPPATGVEPGRVLVASINPSPGMYEWYTSRVDAYDPLTGGMTGETYTSGSFTGVIPAYVVEDPAVSRGTQIEFLGGRYWLGAEKTVDRPGWNTLLPTFPVLGDPGTLLPEIDEHSGEEVWEELIVSVEDTHLGQPLSFPSTPTNDLFGFQVTASEQSTTEWVVIAPPAPDISVGDILELGGLGTWWISEVDGGRVRLSTPVPDFPGSVSCTVWRGTHSRYNDAVQSLGKYPADARSKLDGLVAQVSRGQTANLLSAEAGKQAALLRKITDTLLLVSAPVNYGIDAALQMFREHGMERALDFLTSLRFHELSQMTHDGVSYSTHLTRASATAAREIAPVGRQVRETDTIMVDVDVPSDLNDG